MSYIDYLRALGEDVSKMRAIEHVDFKTDDAFGTVFFKEGRALLAYVYTWADPGPESLLNDLGYMVRETAERGNGHYTCLLGESKDA